MGFEGLTGNEDERLLPVCRPVVGGVVEVKRLDTRPFSGPTISSENADEAVDFPTWFAPFWIADPLEWQAALLPVDDGESASEHERRFFVSCGW